jgi:hypothetical protein
MIKQAKGINKYLGLMFRTSRTSPLIFKFPKTVSIPIHSYFVFFPFTAIWTFEDGTKEERIILPFNNNIKPSKQFITLEEYPLQCK